MTKPIPAPVRSFARGFYRDTITRGKAFGTMCYEGRWDIDANAIVVTSILGETFIVPIAANWSNF